MTRTTALIIAIAALALTGVVPTALGGGRAGDVQQNVDFWNYESGAKVADSSPGVAPSDLAQLFSSAGLGVETGTNGGAQDIARLLVAKNGVLDASVAGALDTSSVASDSGTDIAWDQVGVGIGIGLILVLGLALAMRIGHVRPFAH